jgi:rare lipoprotein A
LRDKSREKTSKRLFMTQKDENTRKCLWMPTRFARLLIASLVILVLLGGVSGCRKKVRTAKPPRIGDREVGVASWYGHPYHGRRAANGEIYDMNKLTAAHRTLPFETWVRVHNLTNDRSVDVRIQDRGPFVNGRIIDLSRAAAERIDLVGPGIARVRLTVITPPENLDSQRQLFAVQVGAYRDRGRAEAVRDSMQRLHGHARLVERAGNPPIWRVLVGRVHQVSEAEALAARIRTAGTEAFTVRLDAAD